jgi:hypothetical protein
VRFIRDLHSLLQGTPSPWQQGGVCGVEAIEPFIAIGGYQGRVRGFVEPYTRSEIAVVARKAVTRVIDLTAEHEDLFCAFGMMRADRAVAIR